MCLLTTPDRLAVFGPEVQWYCQHNKRHEIMEGAHFILSRQQSKIVTKVIFYSFLHSQVLFLDLAKTQNKQVPLAQLCISAKYLKKIIKNVKAMQHHIKPNTFCLSFSSTQITTCNCCVFYFFTTTHFISMSHHHKQIISVFSISFQLHQSHFRLCHSFH